MMASINGLFMTKSLQKIRKEKEQLEEKSTQLFTELNNIYKHYLESLSLSVKKQLVLAVYQICTQVYPEEFLKLSYSRREKLQGTIKQFYQRLESQFLAYITFPQPAPPVTITEQILKQLSGTNETEFQLPNEEQELPFSEIVNPEDLVLWCKRLEKGIRIILHELSQEVNRELQTNQIIASKLPPQLLEMALQSEESDMSSGNSPNILNLLVETRNKEEEQKDSETDDDDDKESQITKISAIHLRLSDIEFADHQLSIQRQQIRQQLEILKKMRKAYQKIQREQAQAEAEAAWRSSWHD
jgi:polyhydroxyalkanoate synthesis regulator protein